MARRLLVLTTAALFLVTAACSSDDDKIASDDKTTSTTAAGGPTETETGTEPDTETGSEPDTESGTESESESEVEDGDETSQDDATQGGDGSNPQFCATAQELGGLFEGLAQDDYQGFVDTVEGAEGTFGDFLDSLPEDLNDEGEVLVDAVRMLGDELKPLVDDPDADAKVEAAFEKVASPEVQEAGDAIGAYQKKVCGDL